MRALGIDLGTSCGWAGLRDGRLRAGYWDLRPSKHKNKEGFRYISFRIHFTRLINHYQPDFVFYEDVKAHKGTKAAHVYGGLRAQLRQVCDGRGITHKGIAVQTIKKHATGSGRAKKVDMVASARQRWPGLKIERDDVADAAWTLACGVEGTK